MNGTSERKIGRSLNHRSRREKSNKGCRRARPVPKDGDLMDFADHIFLNKPLSEEFGKLPYKEEKNGFTWDVPK
jgi:hypothetical protein